MCTHASMLWTLALALLISALVVNAANNSRDSQNNPAVPNTNQQANRPNTRSENTKQVSDSVTNLATKVANALANSNSKTEIFSPVSIAGALSPLLLGSGGQTQKELLRVMGLDNLPLSFQDIHVSFGRLFQDLVTNDLSLEPQVTWNWDDECIRYVDENEYYEDFPSKSPTDPYEKDPLIKVVNGVFVKDGNLVDLRYDQLTKELYQAQIYYLNFVGNERGSVRFINKWMLNQTNGRIADIVQHISPETMMMIANTLYFNSLWEEPFQQLDISNRRFFPNGPDGPDSFDVSMMVKSHCMPYYHWQEENVRVVGVPYRHNVTMYIFMPINSTRELLQSLQWKLSAERINDIVGRMKMTLVTLLFPKMHIANSISLKSVLQQLGVYTLFDGKDADLSRLLKLQRYGEEEDILDILVETMENPESYLRQYHPDCTVTVKTGIRRGACLKQECVWGGRTCLCCVEQGVFRRRRRDLTNAMVPSKLNESIFVNEMLHKVDLTLNERGTEGDATTTTLNYPSDQVNFIVNGPFFMMIREETTRLPLFYGNIYNPK